MEKVYQNEVLDDLFPHYDFYNKKGIDSKNLKLLKGGLATKGKCISVLSSIYNEHSQIHGFSGRDMANRDVPK